jgi:hypothetical protein
MFASHVAKTVLACAVLGLDIAVLVQKPEGKYTFVGLGIDCGLL